MNTKQKTSSHLKRKRRTNASVKANKPAFRCVVAKSLKHIRAQLIDANGNIVATVTDLKALSGTKTEKATQVGTLIAQQALEKKITTCVFDRNGNLYHGRVKALCEAMREAGIVI